MNYKTGLKDGIPIALGYLSVSFTFGIMSITCGLSSWQALLISMLTLTSAGQLAAIKIMVNPASYFEMFISQITINVRYAFMGIVLSQKTDTKFKGIWKWLLGFFITDEIFGVASTKENVTRRYLFSDGNAENAFHTAQDLCCCLVRFFHGQGMVSAAQRAATVSTASFFKNTAIFFIFLIRKDSVAEITEIIFA